MAKRRQSCNLRTRLADGTSRIFADGLRNAVGMHGAHDRRALDGQERDGLGDETLPTI